MNVTNLSSAKFAIVATTVALALTPAVGCKSSGDHWKFASLNPKRLWSKEADKPDPETPSRLVAAWTNAQLNTPGETPKRGFGGRIVFFKQEQPDPVRVEGQLVVYAFDETDRPAYETQPTRRYIFPAEEFLRHESATAQGTAYSVWLPWDAANGPERRISLIARFEPKEGGVVLSEQTRHYLPGPAGTPEAPQLAAKPLAPPATAAPTQPTPQFPVQQAAFNQPTDPTGAAPLPASPLETTTIALPKKLAMHPASPMVSRSAAADHAAVSAPPTAVAEATAPAPASAPSTLAPAPLMATPVMAQPLRSFPPATRPAPTAPVAR